MRMNQSRALTVGSLLGALLAACNGSSGDDGGAQGGSGSGATAGTTDTGTGGTSTAGVGAQSAGSNTGGIGVGGSETGRGGGGGAPMAGTGGATATGGGGAAAGGEVGGRGGAGGSGGSGPLGGRGGKASSGGAAGGTGGTGAGAGGKAGMSSSGGSAGASTGTCTKSTSTGKNVSGNGPHKVVVETNSDSGIAKGTIYRPSDLGGAEKYPIFVWGEGGCSQNGLSNSAAMAEIASYGYFVVADGTPNGTGNITMDRSKLAEMGAPLIAYIDWAVAENDKPCSAYYQSLDTTKIAADGFSCGGLMSQGTITDSRITTWGVTSSGMAGADQSFYDLIHTPVLFVLGGTGDVAYDGGLEGYQAIAQLDVPVLWLSKDLGHGGDLSSANGGDFTKINLAWLNWWLKGDETATGKGMLVGSSCPYCTDSAWDVQSAHLP